MQELVKITTNAEGNQVVNARDLHQFLVKDAKGGQIGEDFSNWIKRMLDYGFQKSIDFDILEFDWEGNLIHTKSSESDSQALRIFKRDYVLSISAAKEIAMIQNNDKGKEVRQYFIECERKSNLPTNYLEALKELVASVQENQRLAQETSFQKQIIEEQKPKVEFYNQVADTTTSFDMQEVAAMLKLNYGRNILFRKLREASVLMEDNLPYRSHINNGYLLVVETKWMNPKTDQATATFQTRITQKGLDWLQKNQEKFRL